MAQIDIFGVRDGVRYRITSVDVSAEVLEGYQYLEASLADASCRLEPIVIVDDEQAALKALQDQPGFRDAVLRVVTRGLSLRPLSA